MPKDPKKLNPKSKPVPPRKKGSMNGALNWFLAGCIAECYLLIVRRFFVNGTLDQVIAWDSILRNLMYFGLGLAAVGLIGGLVLLKKPGKGRTAFWIVFGAGAFVALANWLTRLAFPTGNTVLCVVVPVVMVLGLLWSLYDRASFLSMIALCATVLVLWICRRGLNSGIWHTRILIGGAIYLVLLAVLALLVRKADGSRGTVGNLALLPADADCLPIYLSCGVSGAAVIVALFSAAAAYYALWVVGILLFLLALYDTVKQL